MFDINDKERLIAQIKNEIDACYVGSDVWTNGGIDSKIVELVRPMIDRASRDAAKAAAESIIRHLYTYSEFEKDLGLK